MGGIKGNIASFETMGLVDGPGVRFVVFLQGCPLRCTYCHNPEMWTFDEKKVMTANAVFEKIKKYKPYFKKDGGVTVSGGEPLAQGKFVSELFKLCKADGIHTCLDTSGFGEASDELLENVDLVILDVKELDEKKYQSLTGQKIDKFHEFLKKCQESGVKLWLRQVILPNYNDTEENVLKLKAFAEKLKNVEKIELLPYHDMAKKKYKELGLEYRLKDVSAMDKKKCKNLESLLK
ncbi:MAG: pyruvate formate lyase-activating protein [Clostridia bacterium]|nr:pyruvate formate lyase-activating protein [Clostridia bacterium]